MKRRLIRALAPGALTVIRWLMHRAAGLTLTYIRFGIQHGFWKSKEQNERLLGVILQLRQVHEATEPVTILERG